MKARTEALRVLIAEDDYLVREGAKAVLDSAGVDVLGVASDPDELLACLEHDHPDAVVLDIRMPPTHTTEGIDLALRLRAEHPALGIVILSQHADPEYALELLRDGSERLAYLLKERLGDSDKLVGALEEVTAGGSMLDPKIVDSLLQAQRRRSASRLAGLTPRELDVLALMAQGKGNAAIAADLVVTERAVEKHISSIFARLGLTWNGELNRRVAAVLFYLQRSHE